MWLLKCVNLIVDFRLVYLVGEFWFRLGFGGLFVFLGERVLGLVILILVLFVFYVSLLISSIVWWFVGC